MALISGSKGKNKKKGKGINGKLSDNSGDDIDGFNEGGGNDESALTAGASNMKLEEDANTCFTRTSLSSREEWCQSEIKTFKLEQCAEIYCTVCCSLYVPFSQINKCAVRCEEGTAHVPVHEV